MSEKEIERGNVCACVCVFKGLCSFPLYFCSSLINPSTELKGEVRVQCFRSFMHKQHGLNMYLLIIIIATRILNLDIIWH